LGVLSYFSAIAEKFNKIKKLGFENFENLIKFCYFLFENFISQLQMKVILHM